MARKKQKPHRSGGVQGKNATIGENLKHPTGSEPIADQESEEQPSNKPYLVEIDRASWCATKHNDVSEIVLTNLNVTPEFIGHELTETFYQDSTFGLRFRLCNVNENAGRMALGHWPIFSSSDVYLEFVQRRVLDDDTEKCDVIATGSFDGPDEGMSGLVHLVSLKFMTLRPVLGFILKENTASIRVRVEILDSAFRGCESLLEHCKRVWRKSMLNAMAWLRPEVVTTEVRYGVEISSDIHLQADEDEDSNQNRARFDVARFYDAIKPSKNSPELEEDLPDLLPTLRPYQRRAVHWMVNREKGASAFVLEEKRKELLSPLCVAVKILDADSRLFYNPFSGSISLHPEDPPPYVRGGILADEMGLGKTVELLACIFAHQKTSSESCSFSEDVSGGSLNENNNLKRVKRERVECVCGAVTESSKYKGDWIQCDICDAWQHVDCVDYSSTRRSKKSRVNTSGKLDKNNRRKIKTPVVMETGDEFICQLCLELIEATKSPIVSGATLIVCPAPILPQWHAEIVRHTTPGSLKTHIYEGVRDTSLSRLSILDVSELADADVVLTTYDVLKADLSHDSDRHEGDRRLMRYQKRYPVIPTPLTRIYWWRVCLDEAQMVEGYASSATEMALRLHVVNHWCITGTPIQRKLDDLYGLIRFLKASPFDGSRWWADVIRDPYEKGDSGAMEFTHDLFRQLMWRSSKLNVADELMLPPQEENLTWLSFSAVEEHFYQRQHDTCVNIAREVLANLKKDILKRRDKGSTCDISDFVITHVEAAKLLNSLLKLRQACCHPQVGSSGLRSIQQSPMTMDEILSVLVSKTKVEGEDALRKVVSSLNGLAGIAIIQNEFSQAVELYKEALALAEEHAEDFRLDPLLNLHIHHNISDLLKPSLSSLTPVPCNDAFDDNPSASCPSNECSEHVSKKRKLMDEAPSDMDRKCERTKGVKFASFDINLGCGRKCDGESIPIKHNHESLLKACDSIKQKYLLPFYSRLSQAQTEFHKSYTQVYDASNNKKYQHTWWLEALDQIEQNQDSVNELRKRIENAVLGSRGASKSSRSAPHFRNISALMYFIQTRVDALEESRKKLLDRVMEIDQTMEHPRDEDVQRVRYCPKCLVNEDGPLCVHCELDDLFQGYEARLFLLKRDGDGRSVNSVEEALNLQKQKTDLNQFYLNLTNKSKTSSSSNVDSEEIKRKGNMWKNLVVSRLPSELEVILGVLRSYLKPQLSKEGLAEANKHILQLEGMRKEYVHARSLAIAQAQILRAHDEINMATSRLRLRENVDDVSIDALSLEELDVASAENSSEKFASLASLTLIKGKLRYLQGLVRSKQKIGYAPGVASGLHYSSHTEEEKDSVKADETCPVCQEKLKNQRMVFQCGHLTCCKCLVAMTEHMELVNGKGKGKWVMCPTCRQHSDFSSIALADDNKNDDSSSVQDRDESEASVQVQGSYGTKLEAITRRILWIKATEPNAKVLVFSSWKDVLDVLEHAFAANQISYVRMKGGRKAQVAISIFKGENCGSEKPVSAKKKGSDSSKVEDQKRSSIQVLLILIQHGANGLNLLEAKHVILVEPLLNPAAEAQAISRVHRIGQGNKTLIHRFMVKGTVEESIHRLNQNKSQSSSSLISGSKKNSDEPDLTLRDIESLFSTAASSSQSKNEEEQQNEISCGSLMHLPPSVAAAIAAERRVNENRMS